MFEYKKNTLSCLCVTHRVYFRKKKYIYKYKYKSTHSIFKKY